MQGKVKLTDEPSFIRRAFFFSYLQETNFQPFFFFFFRKQDTGTIDGAADEWE